MVDNAPIISCQHAGLTIEGYSRAAVQSYWRIPELKIGFDLGAQPWDFMGTPTWLITHTHLDHVAALPVYVARRRMMRMEPPTLYLPAESLEDVRRLLLVMQRLDRGRMICQLNGLKVGDEVELSRETVVTLEEIVRRMAEYRPLIEIPHARSETARRYHFDDGIGEIGIIAPVSHPFCGHCSRIRITSDGKIRTCLFSIWDHDLHGLMKRGASDEELAEFIRGVVQKKEERHHIGEPDFVPASRTMVHIGG